MCFKPLPNRLIKKSLKAYNSGDDSGFTNTLILEEYDYDTVTFYPYFMGIWIAKQPVEITVS